MIFTGFLFVFTQFLRFYIRFSFHLLRVELDGTTQRAALLFLHQLTQVNQVLLSANSCSMVISFYRLIQSSSRLAGLNRGADGNQKFFFFLPSSFHRKGGILFYLVLPGFVFSCCRLGVSLGTEGRLICITGRLHASVGCFSFFLSLSFVIYSICVLRVTPFSSVFFSTKIKSVLVSTALGYLV